MTDDGSDQIQARSNQQRFAAATEAGVPRLYANTFLAAMSGSDVVVLMERNGEPECVLNLSFTMAKTLSIAIGQGISQIETGAGRDIMTSSEIEQFLSVGNAPQ